MEIQLRLGKLRKYEVTLKLYAGGEVSIHDVNEVLMSIHDVLPNIYYSKHSGALCFILLPHSIQVCFTLFYIYVKYVVPITTHPETAFIDKYREILKTVNLIINAIRKKLPRLTVDDVRVNIELVVYSKFFDV